MNKNKCGAGGSKKTKTNNRRIKIFVFQSKFVLFGGSIIIFFCSLNSFLEGVTKKKNFFGGGGGAKKY